MSTGADKTPTPSASDATAKKAAMTTTTAAATSTTAMEAVEEDDEFEEFEPAHWAAGDENAEDAQQWMDNWDVDDMDDDFTKNLRAELAKSSSKQ
jgi:26 proteasome complex subunit DSS1